MEFIDVQMSLEDERFPPENFTLNHEHFIFLNKIKESSNILNIFDLYCDYNHVNEKYKMFESYSNRIS